MIFSCFLDKMLGICKNFVWKVNFEIFVSIININSQRIFGTIPDCVGMRYLSVNGYENRTNDVIYCRPLVENEIKSTVIYFGGDIQVCF